MNYPEALKPRGVITGADFVAAVLGGATTEEVRFLVIQARQHPLSWRSVLHAYTYKKPEHVSQAGESIVEKLGAYGLLYLLRSDAEAELASRGAMA